MNLKENKIFFKLREPNGIQPSEPEAFKQWRNSQKTPITTWKTTEKNTYYELENSSNIGMIIPDGYVIVDIDNREQADIIEKTLNQKGIKCIKSRTGKGTHFLFKDKKWETRTQSNGTITQTAIKVDYRVAGKGYVAVKFLPDAGLLENDGERFVGDLDLNNIDEIPTWLEPIKEQWNVKAKEVSSNGWTEGVRDDNLMYWVNVIWNSDINDQDQLIELVSLINFYIMSKPLFRSVEELIKKVNNWKKYVNENKKDKVKNNDGDFDTKKKIHIDEDIVLKGKELLEVINIVTLTNEEGDMLYLQDDKTLIYKPLNRNELIRRLERQLSTENYFVEDKHVKDMSKVMMNASLNNTREYDEVKNNILVNNGYIINTKNGIEFVEATSEEQKEIIALKRVDLNYKKDLHKQDNPIITKFFNDIMCDDEKLVDYLWHALATPFADRTKYEKAFVLYGKNGANGKTVLSELMRNVFSKRNVTHVELAEMKDWNLAIMDRGMVNWVQDLEKFDSWPNFKKIVTGESIVVNVKYSDPIEKEISTQLFINSNVLPTLGTNRDGGYVRRLEFIPFDRVFKGEEKDSEIIFKLTREENLEWVFSKLINIANELAQDKAGSWFVANRPRRVEMLMEEQSKKDSSAISFMDWIKHNTIITNNKEIYIDNTEDFFIAPEYQTIGVKNARKGKVLFRTRLYNLYKNYCDTNGQKPLNKANFDDHLNSIKCEVMINERVSQAKGLVNVDNFMTGEENE